MKFCELTREEYRQFQELHPYRNFLNAVETMDLEEAIGLKTVLVGLKMADKVVCATPLVRMPAMRKFFYFYSPRGMLVDYEQPEQIHFFITHLKRYAKQQGAMYIIVDPYVLYKERDIDGTLVEGGFDHSDRIALLEANGFHHLGFPNGYGHTMQYVRWMFSLSLKGKTTDQILKDMHQRSRGSIQKTLKSGVQVRELAYDELNVFYDILKHTGERRNFENRDLQFYQKQQQAYQKYLKVLLAYLDVNVYVENIHKEQEIAQAEVLQLKQEREAKPHNKKLEKRQKVAMEMVETTKKWEQEAQRLQTKHGDIIPMAASMFVFYKGEATYLTSGSYDEFKSFYASYALQWEALKYAIQAGCDTYNFYGISGVFEETSPDYGVYKFKRGFHGQVEELIGDFVMPTRPWLYKLYKALKGGH